MKTNTSLFKVLAGVVVLGLAGFGIWKLQTPDEETLPKEESTPTAETTPKKPSTTTTTTTTTSQTAKYKDGTYTADGSYRAGTGTQSVGITLTIKDGVIVSGEALTKAHDATSKKYQDLFKAGFNAVVAGKSLDTVSVDVVNGSSLTAKGFDEALVKIKTQAEA